MSNTAKSQTMAEKSQSDKKSNPPNIKKAHQQAKYALRDRKVRRSPSPCRKIRTRRLVTEQLKSESNLKLVDKSTDKKRQRDDGDQLGDQKKQKTVQELVNDFTKPMMDHISDTVERNLAAKLSSSYIIEDKKVTEEICNNSVDEFLNMMKSRINLDVVKKQMNKDILKHNYALVEKQNEIEEEYLKNLESLHIKTHQCGACQGRKSEEDIYNAPCGHMLCYACSFKLQLAKGSAAFECPLCRRLIGPGVSRVFHQLMTGDPFGHNPEPENESSSSEDDDFQDISEIVLQERFDESHSDVEITGVRYPDVELVFGPTTPAANDDECPV